MLRKIKSRCNPIINLKRDRACRKCAIARGGGLVILMT
jgi:hypothetical protein